MYEAFAGQCRQLNVSAANLRVSIPPRLIRPLFVTGRAGPSQCNGHAGPQSAAQVLHLDSAEVSSGAGYLFYQLVPMPRESPDCVAVPCEPGSREQVVTVVELLSEGRHGHYLWSSV